MTAISGDNTYADVTQKYTLLVHVMILYNLKYVSYMRVMRNHLIWY